jgi:hypothetical protein
MEDGKYNRRPRGRSLIAQLVKSLLVIALINIVHVHSLDLTIESMREEGLEKHDISIFIEKKVEFIHSRISLKPLISSIEHGFKISNEYSVKVNSSLGRILGKKLRNMMVTINRKLETMINKNDRDMNRALISNTRRSKRAIEFVGNLISKLFGNPGPEEWRQNTRNLLAMKSAIERQLSNAVILHRDIDQNRHAINEQNEILKHVSKELMLHSNRLDSVDSALLEFETYLELEMLFRSVMEILHMLEKIRLDSRVGRCNEDGVNQEFLIEHLRELESNKLGIAPIFASWEWHKYYLNSMCSIAIHERDLWITMRIPIVNLAEQLVRVIPLSNQIWMRDNFYQYGLETALLKNKREDVYMIIMKSNLEGCSKLDMFKVCNIRDTKFRVSDPFVVPIDIGHDRAVIISNSTANVTAKMNCNGETRSLLMSSESVVRIAEKCQIIGKTFEIGKNIDSVEVADAIKLTFPEMDLMRKISRKKMEDNKVEKHSEVIQTKDNDSNFEFNNNKTIEELDSIRFTSTESMLVAVSGSSVGILVTCVIVILVIVYCLKKHSHTGDNGTHRLVLDLENAAESRSEKANSIDQILSESQESDESPDPEKDKLARDMNIKKPPFQQKQRT